MGIGKSVASENDAKDQGPTAVSFFDPALKGVRGRVIFQLLRMGELCAWSYGEAVLANDAVCRKC